MMKRVLTLLMIFVICAAAIPCASAATLSGKTEEATFEAAMEAKAWDMTADVIAIAPAFGVYTQSNLSYKTVYDSVICKCATMEGEVVWAHMTVDEYKANFNAEAKIDSAAFAYSDLVLLDAPVRVSGLATEADSIVSDLSSSVGTTTVLTFGEAEVIEGAEILEYVYTAETDPMTCVYAEIVSIVPAYTLTGGTSLAVNDVVCRCENVDGVTIWVAMPVASYNADIDENAQLSFSNLLSFEQVNYAEPVTIHGVAIAADDVATGLASATGMQTVICFSSAE